MATRVKGHIRKAKNGAIAVRPHKRKTKVPYHQMIGDGKLPNLYWVSISNDFVVFNEDSGAYEGADTEIEGFKSEGKTFPTPFKTYREAKEVADKYIYEMTDRPSLKTINRITIEDRLSGEVFEATIYAKKLKDYLGGYKTRVNEREDLAFTRKKIEEAGYTFQ